MLFKSKANSLHPRKLWAIAVSTSSNKILCVEGPFATREPRPIASNVVDYLDENKKLLVGAGFATDEENSTFPGDNESYGTLCRRKELLFRHESILGRFQRWGSVATNCCRHGNNDELRKRCFRAVAVIVHIEMQMKLWEPSKRNTQSN